MEPSEVEPTELSSDMNQMEIDMTLQSDGQSKRRRQISNIWHHFIVQRGGDKCACKYCGKLIVGGGSIGTKGLHGHYKSCRKLHPKSTKGDGSASGSAKIGDYHYDENESRRLLARMIIKHEYPLSMVEHDGFQDFCKSLHPLFRVVSRATIKRDILKIYEHEKEKTMNLLSTNSSRIAITTDMWTSNNQKRGFMTVTSHFINDSWVLNSRLIRFIYVPCPHTAEVLAAALMDCLTDWGIDGKLSALTVDNCSTNDAMLEEIVGNISFNSQLIDGELFHMRCCAHILNLIVRDGLEVIASSIEKIRGCVAYWSATQKREEKFLDMAKSIGCKNPTKLILDCRTRWNSTYLMLQSAAKYKDVFSRLKREYKAIPSEDDWALSKVISDKLNVFFKVTLLFSGTKYPTANLYFPNVCHIKIGINNWLKSEQLEVRLMAQQMSLKFDKYWKSIHHMMAVATVLDPRCKMEMIEFYFPLIYEDNASQAVERIRDLISRLTGLYRVRVQAGQRSSQSSSSPYSVPFDLEDDSLASFDSYVSSKKKKDCLTSELEDYLLEKLIPRTAGEFDILEWWKVNGTRYPTLQAMARDVLAIPVSTVASESAFSTSGRVVSSHRSRLHADTLEALMCARDWMWGEMKAAGINSKGDCTFDDDFDISELKKDNTTLYD